MRFADFYTVDEAAERIGVAPRKLLALLSRGEMVGERLGRTWLIPAAEIARGVPHITPVGRPFAERLSWAVLATLEGRKVPGTLAREERARLAGHVARPIGELAPRLRGRARTERLSVSASALEKIAASGDYVLGGARALRLVGSVRAAALDLYLRSDVFEAFLDETLAVPDRAFPNLIVHLVSPNNWPFGDRDGEEVAWTSAALLDLFEVHALDSARLTSAVAGLVGDHARSLSRPAQ
jgi:excisionase family DNA binding protein